MGPCGRPFNEDDFDLRENESVGGTP